jgi:GTP-binding protein
LTNASGPAQITFTRKENLNVPIPQVAIVGRPNVGKSSLLNWLAGKRISIVEPSAGVTRDRVSTLIAADGRFFELVDTGGMGVHDVDELTADIERQIAQAIDQAALVLFVVDARAGVTSLDELVAGCLRALDKPILCLANKCDVLELEPETAEFFKLGFSRVLPVSAQQGRRKKELLDWIRAHLPTGARDTPGSVVLKLAIVGRRNTGKSTFINSVARSERVIVSEVPGTTRDSVDVRFEREGKVYVAIDTAGIRRKKSIASNIEFYSLARAERSIRRADVVLHFHDAKEPVSKVDKQLAGYILENYKPAIFVVNKWDLARGKVATGEVADYLHQVFPSLDFVPIAFITARTGKNVQAVLDLAQNLHKQASARVSTGDLNRVLREALTRQAPPLRQNRRARIYYATQVAANPPTLVLFTNGPELFDNTYQRYLLNIFREQLPFREVPVKMYLRKRLQSEQTGEPEDREAPQSRVKKSRPPTQKLGHRPRPRKGGGRPELWKD